jgi:outer membrane lipoprotein-sorting protein
MKKTIFLTGAIICFALAGQIAYSLSGEDILTKVEQTLTAPLDYEGKATMVLGYLNGSQREERELKIWMAGKEKRLIKFLSPAGMAEIGLLVEGEDEMYLYLPAQNKIRRIEGANKNDDFQGTDFSYNELGSYEFRNDFTAELKGEDSTTYELLLSRKRSSDKNYDRMVMVVDKSNFVPKKIEFYNGEKLKKTLWILEIQQTGKYTVPVKLKMENKEKNHFTEMTVSGLKFDQGLAAKNVFSKRFLKLKAR